jgi:hypothetical protein
MSASCWRRTTGAHGLTDTAERKQRLGIESGIRAALEHHAGKTVQRVGEGIPRRWRLMV